MASAARLSYEVSVLDAQGRFAGGRQETKGWVPGLTGGVGQRNPVTLTASVFTAITVPTGARWVAIILGSAVSLTLKGLTTDAGIAMTPATNSLGVDALLPLNGVTTFGILNGLASAQTIEVYFL